MRRSKDISKIFEIMENLFKDSQHWPFHSLSKTASSERIITYVASLRTFARNFSNIDFFLKILPLKDDQLAMSEM